MICAYDCVLKYVGGVNVYRRVCLYMKHTAMGNLWGIVAEVLTEVVG